DPEPGEIPRRHETILGLQERRKERSLAGAHRRVAHLYGPGPGAAGSGKRRVPVRAGGGRDGQQLAQSGQLVVIVEVRAPVETVQAGDLGFRQLAKAEEVAELRHVAVVLQMLALSS